MNHVNIGQTDFNSPVSLFARKPSVTLNRDQKVGEAISRLRLESQKEKDSDEDILYLYVVDSSEKLTGVVPVRRLLLSPSESTIGEIMVANIVSIPETASLHDATLRFLDKRFLALPITDSEGKLSGVIDIAVFSDEIPKFLRRNEMDSVFQLLGCHANLGRNVSPFRSFMDRFPWLLTNIAGGIICAAIAGMHESLIAYATILALFIPVVLTLAESVGMQSMTISLDAILPNLRPWQRIFLAGKREFPVALLLGLGSGLCVAAISLIWKRQPLASAAIGTSIALAIVTSCLLGIIIPGAVKAYFKKPSIASGPIVLALADIATLTFFFNMAGWLLS